MLNLFGNRRFPLSGYIGQRRICEVRTVPGEATVYVEISDPNPVLRLEDADGKVYNYDLASVVQDGCRWGSFSVRVSQGLACQADAIMTKGKCDPDKAFHDGQALGLRFQPFYLSGCDSPASELVGRGLFYRGSTLAASLREGMSRFPVFVMCVSAASASSLSIPDSAPIRISIAARDRTRWF